MLKWWHFNSAFRDLHSALEASDLNLHLPGGI
jgi:hypothetical protein